MLGRNHEGGLMRTREDGTLVLEAVVRIKQPDGTFKIEYPFRQSSTIESKTVTNLAESPTKCGPNGYRMYIVGIDSDGNTVFKLADEMK